MEYRTAEGRQFGIPFRNVKVRHVVTAIFLMSLAGCMESPVAVTLGCPDTPMVYRGEATFYNATGGGAMNPIDYAGSSICGASVSVTGPKGTVLIHIVDLCSGCMAGDIDLSPQAFDAIADTSRGRVPITWYITASAVSLSDQSGDVKRCESIPDGRRSQK